MKEYVCEGLYDCLYMSSLYDCLYMNNDNWYL